MENTPPLEYVGIASAIGIILVVFGHSIPPHLTFPNDDLFSIISYAIVDYIYVFHMPLFFFISGLLFIHTNTPNLKRKYSDLLKNKAVRLLLPYLVLGTLAFIPKIFLAEFAKNPIEPSLEYYLRTIIYPWNNSIRFFWFLPTLFLMFLIAPIVLNVIHREQLKLQQFYNILIFVMLVSLNYLFDHNQKPETFMNYSGVFHNLIYFWLGMWIYNKLGKSTNKRVFETGIHTLLWGVILFSLSVIMYLFFNNNVAELLSAVFAILGVITLSVFLVKTKLEILKLIGKYSYQIYLFSFFFQVPVQLILYYKLQTGSALLMVGSFVIGLFGPLLAVYIIKSLKIRGQVLVGL
ncbi:MAG: acyltransferase [Gammaproteobacteria bacterium]|nr:acyltransferase [Gammaproteobacteria bacterium]